MADTTPTRPGTQQAPASSHDAPVPSRPRDIAERAVDEVKALGTELFSAVRDSATSLIDEQRERAATEVHAVGEVLRSTVKSLDDAGAGTVARYADDAARQVHQVADRLRKSSWQELQADIESFARNWPVAYIAAAMGIGFVAGRVMVSSTPASASRAGHGTLDAGHPFPEPASTEATRVGSGMPGTTTVGFGTSGSGEIR